MLGIRSTIGLNSNKLICGYGIKCPVLANTRQTLTKTINAQTLMEGESGHVKLKLFDPKNMHKRDIYCVEFRVRVVSVSV